MGRTVNEVIARTVEELPEPLRALVKSSIKFVVRARPSAADIELGAEPTDQGFFVGFPVLGEDEDAGDLYQEEGEDIATPESAAVLRADEGDLVAEVEPYTPGGTISIFTANIRPLNETTVTEVILHELAHFAGEDEEGVFALGLGDTEADDPEAPK